MQSQVHVIRRPANRGFTLIEILIVVVILGILSSIVIPQFTSATRQAREATLKDCLRYLRSQVGAYRVQHGDVSPGYANGDTTVTPTAADFISQMTLYTDTVGATNATGSAVFVNSPYLTEMPANPLTSKSGILIVVGAMPAPDPSQSYGWMYNPQTQQIMANVSGVDESGVAYTSY